MEKTNSTSSHLQSLLAFSFSFLALFHLTAHAQSLPPPKFDGFVYGNHSLDFNTIHIEAFFDPVCPDSRDSWPPLKKALDHYGSRVRLVIHLLPLPYHDNAYAASRALHIVDLVNPSDTFKLLEAFFGDQKQFYNAETRYLSRAAIVDSMVKFGVEVLGDSYKNTLVTGFNDRETDLLTRVSFKFSTSRGVYGTPFFFINGFLAPDKGSPLNYTEWRNLIDPLIKKNKRSGSQHLSL
ncbi:uncharacterized protein LOC101216804 [Cucumis sativus]|uniref:Thioredoxin-like fold domain-containing protein n=1 Tax=Cucumis sativus TaxID=3659 RepID=A0A0A0LKC9_CUCSA|nr:uncharacterized protein LOC101216804 [Cucumis sativus]KGN62258.1 hypothetical protein Csa_018779 [Cucumis sativus]